MNWTCPFCGRDQTVTRAKLSKTFSPINITGHDLGVVGTVTRAVGCANSNCNKLTVVMELVKGHENGNSIFQDAAEPAIISKNIRPEGTFVIFPEYIPKVILEDYKEACLIRDLSPKASATLSRRCLQGMIRDFAKIARPTLNQEIIELRRAVEAESAPKGVSIESVIAIDHVRTIGNIGAHMEKDVEHIISVESGEAQLLIDLIEGLLKEWYVERHIRQERFQNIAALADAKKLAKALPAISATALPAPATSPDITRG